MRNDSAVSLLLSNFSHLDGSSKTITVGLIEVDGGVTIDNAQALREAGANILVAGTAICESTDVWASAALLKGE